MNIRLALLELIALHRLDGAAWARLWRLARFDEQPERLFEHVRIALALLAAVLGGLGVILWIAANWDAMGRTAHFVLLQGFVLTMCAGAAMLPPARKALSLLALLSIGGLFAYFGQTYQTGADPWQLFALWGLLALPLCFGTRSDGLWAGWIIVAALAISRWDYAHASYSWGPADGNTGVHTSAWGAALLVTLLLSPFAQRFTGASLWAYRASLTFSILFVALLTAAGLFDGKVAAYYWLGLLLLVLATWALVTSRLYDLYGLSVAGLGLNIAVVCGLGYALLHGVSSHEPIAQLLLLGLIAAAMLAGTVKGIVMVSRQRESAKGGSA